MAVLVMAEAYCLRAPGVVRMTGLAKGTNKHGEVRCLQASHDGNTWMLIAQAGKGEMKPAPSHGPAEVKMPRAVQGDTLSRHLGIYRTHSNGDNHIICASVFLFARWASLEGSH